VASVRTADGVEQFFLGVLSAGFDSNVTERANSLTWPPGALKYLRALVQELRSYRAVDFTLEVDGDRRTDRAMFAAVGNGVAYGGGMKVCAGALIDDGLLTVTWAHESSMPHFLATFPKVYRGTHVHDASVTQHTGRRIRIEAQGQLAYADGDRMGPLPIDVAVHPGGLRVLTAGGK
jgi:diacylglycerol kinase (ATP)